VLDRGNRRDGFSMKKKFLSFARGTSFHTKQASNVNAVRVVLLDANSYLAYRTFNKTNNAIEQVSNVANLYFTLKYRFSSSLICDSFPNMSTLFVNNLNQLIILPFLMKTKDISQLYCKHR
jgi:hypothetical protein